MASDDEEEFTSLRAEVARERNALFNKIMTAKNGTPTSRGSTSSTMSSRSEKLLRSAVALRSPVNAEAATKPSHQRKKSTENMAHGTHQRKSSSGDVNKSITAHAGFTSPNQTQQRKALGAKVAQAFADTSNTDHRPNPELLGGVKHSNGSSGGMNGTSRFNKRRESEEVSRSRLGRSRESEEVNRSRLGKSRESEEVSRSRLGKSRESEEVSRSRVEAVVGWENEEVRKKDITTSAVASSLRRRLSAGRNVFPATSSSSSNNKTALVPAAQPTSVTPSGITPSGIPLGHHSTSPQKTVRKVVGNDDKHHSTTTATTTKSLVQHDRAATPQRRILMRMYSSNLTEDPSSQNTLMPKGLTDKEIKARQAKEEEAELATLLDRFGAVY